MMYFLPGAKYLAPILGAIAMVLRMLMLLGGTDDRGLYPEFHPAWIALCILSLLVSAGFFLLSRSTDPRRAYRRNFPASVPGAFGHLAGAAGMAITAIIQWKAPIGPYLGILGILSALCLALGGWLRLQGKKPGFYVHMVPCLYFALRIFATGRMLGAEPELSRYLFSFLATLACMMASYHLWGFDVGLGNRHSSLFWSLSAAYLCMAAVPGGNDGILFIGTTIWLLTNLCTLTPRKTRRPAPVREAPIPAPAHPEEMDMDALIAWVKEDLDT